MVRAVSRSARRFTDLAPAATDSATVDECFRTPQPSPLLCLLQRLRPGFGPALVNRRADGFEKIWAQARPSTGPHADLALLITYAPVLDRERVQAILLDLRAMAQRYFDWARTRALTAQEQAALQEELFEVGILTQPPVAQDVKSARDVQAFMTDLFRSALIDVLRVRGLRRFGGVDVIGPQGAVVMLDGRRVGQIRADTLRIRNLPEGTYDLRIELADHLPHVAPVSVVAQKKRTVRPTLILAPNAPAVAARQVLLWTGVAAVAGGVAITTAAILSDDGDARCLPAGADDCPPPARFDELGPFLGAPLGYSLVGAGATWALASYLNDDDQAWPWWEFLVGAAVAGAAYGISAAANPDRVSSGAAP